MELHNQKKIYKALRKKLFKKQHHVRDLWKEVINQFQHTLKNKKIK